MMPDEEFDNPDVAYYVIAKELKQRIQSLQMDLQQIKDPEVRGFAERLYGELKREFFRISKDYVSFVALTKDIEENETEVDTDGIL